MKNRRVVILDDHTLFLKGLSLILKECCADCDIYSYQSIAKLKSDKLDFDEVDLLISDIEMPNEDTFALFTALKRSYKKFPILVVSMHKKNAIIKKCKAIGIDGYLLKDEDEQLTLAVETIINGGEYYSDAIIEFCKKTEDTFVKMSKREEEVIKLIAKGYNNIEISKELIVAVETVKTHKKHIKLKLETDSISDITEYAKKNFLI